MLTRFRTYRLPRLLLALLMAGSGLLALMGAACTMAEAGLSCCHGKAHGEAALAHHEGMAHDEGHNEGMIHNADVPALQDTADASCGLCMSEAPPPLVPALVVQVQRPAPVAVLPDGLLSTALLSRSNAPVVQPRGVLFQSGLLVRLSTFRC